MNNGILTLSWGDVVKAVVLGVLVLAIAYLNQQFNLLDGISPEIKTGLIAGVSYLLKNLFTTNSGKVAGIIPTESL